MRKIVEKIIIKCTYKVIHISAAIYPRLLICSQF